MLERHRKLAGRIGAVALTALSAYIFGEAVQPFVSSNCDSVVFKVNFNNIWLNPKYLSRQRADAIFCVKHDGESLVTTRDNIEYHVNGIPLSFQKENNFVLISYQTNDPSERRMTDIYKDGKLWTTVNKTGLWMFYRMGVFKT